MLSPNMISTAPCTKLLVWWDVSLLIMMMPRNVLLNHQMKIKLVWILFTT